MEGPSVIDFKEKESETIEKNSLEPLKRQNKQLFSTDIYSRLYIFDPFSSPIPCPGVMLCSKNMKRIDPDLKREAATGDEVSPNNICKTVFLAL